MKNRGGALLQAMFVVGVASGLVAVVVQLTTISVKEQKLIERKIARDRIGRNLASALVNPAVLFASSDPAITLSGNAKLGACLGRGVPELVEAELVGPAASGEACDTTVIDMERGEEFLLVPEASYVFPFRRGGSPQNANCPNPGSPLSTRHISCFLGGQRDQEVVAYNFEGETGDLSQAFPLEARVFFKPLCNKTEAVEKCAFAEAMQFRYELTQQKFPGEIRPIYLGTYPSRTEWLTVDSSQILGQQCNPGAIVFASEETGKLECRCQRPFRPLLRNEAPVVNARGPLCEAMERYCPPGFIQTGQDQDGNPVCEELANKVRPTKTINFNTNTPYPESFYSCNQGDSGWISNVTRKCRSAIEYRYIDCFADCTGIAPVLIGLAVGAAVFFIFWLIIAVLLILGVITMPAGVAMLLVLFTILGIAAGGVGGYILGQNWDWFYIDQTRGMYPEISCDITVECSAMQE
ncbi:MAG: hypothetical protein HYW48_06915 [Deltaproteobacteria bacterium]|nr:hypothetical protein [Deltaproteobacteria bacterium]